ncbi:MAG: DUF6783 domain-containing protein [Ruminococcus sp.]
MFCPNSVAVARYGALIRAKSPTNCDAHLAESLFKHALGKIREKYRYFEGRTWTHLTAAKAL